MFDRGPKPPKEPKPPRLGSDAINEQMKQSEVDIKSDDDEEQKKEEVTVCFKHAVVSLNLSDEAEEVVLIVTKKRIYIFKDNERKRAHWIINLQGIIISTEAPFQVLIALPKKDLRI